MTRLIVLICTAFALAVAAVAMVGSAHAEEPVETPAISDAVAQPAVVESPAPEQADTTSEASPGEDSAAAGPPGPDDNAADTTPATEPASELLAPADEPASAYAAPVADAAEEASQTTNGEPVDVRGTSSAAGAAAAAIAAAGEARDKALAAVDETLQDVADKLNSAPPSESTQMASGGGSAAVPAGLADALTQDATADVAAHVEAALADANSAADAALASAAAAVETATQAQADATAAAAAQADAAAAAAQAQAEAAAAAAQAQADAAAAAAQAQADAAAAAAQAQADAAAAAAQAQADAAAAAAQAQADAAAAAAAAAAGVPDPAVIDAMIAVLLEVRAQMTSPEGQALIDQAIAVLLEGYAQAQDGAAAGTGGDGTTPPSDSTTTTSEDTGDVTSDAEAGDTGDATASAGGDAQSGDTGDSTAGGETDSDPPPEDGGPPGPSDDTPPATDEDPAADDSAAVPLPDENDDSGPGSEISGMFLTCEDLSRVKEWADFIVARGLADHPSTVAQIQSGSAGLSWWFHCLDPRPVDGPVTPPANDASPFDGASGVADINETATAATSPCGDDAGACILRVLGDSDVPSVPVIAPAGDAADGASSAGGDRGGAAADGVPPTGSSNSSRTGDPSAPGSVQAYVAPWSAMDLGLGYGIGTTQSTDYVRSRSDKPLVPPG